jgi:peptide/nickel transport system permease protein
MIDNPTLTAPAPTPRSATPSRVRSLASHPIAALILRRLASLIFVVAVVAISVFLMVQLVPGDPVLNAFGENVNLEQLHRLRHEYGLDQPLYRQFYNYVNNVVHGDLGRSFQNQQPVTDLIRQRVGTSLELAGTALMIVLCLGIPLGIAAGALTREGRHRKFELGFTSVTAFFGSIPDYLLGTVLVFLFAVQFRFLPVAGTGGLKTLILPALAVSMSATMALSRVVRVETLNVLAQDYIRTARSQRLPWRSVYARHAGPNVLTAALTIGGLIFANIIGGAVIVENVFARAGLGTALVSAVLSKDYPVIQGITLVLGVTVVLMNTLVDTLLGLVDPRSMAKRQ